MPALSLVPADSPWQRCAGVATAVAVLRVTCQYHAFTRAAIPWFIILPAIILAGGFAIILPINHHHLR